jgi:hypothetical protein
MKISRVLIRARLLILASGLPNADLDTTTVARVDALALMHKHDVFSAFFGTFVLDDSDGQGRKHV